MSCLTRRRFGVLTLSALGASALASCGAEGGDSLRVSFYGEPDVNQSLSAALRLLQRREPELRNSPEPGGFQSYYDKLATRFAGNSAPDVVMTDFTHLTGYAQRGALLDLTDAVPDPIDPSAGREEVLSGGRSGARLYGVPIGTHTQTMLANNAALRRLDLEPPNERLTWERYAELAASVAERSDGEKFGTADAGGLDHALDVWVRQRGGQLFTPTGGLGLTADQLWEWFDFWHRLRRRKAAAPIGVTANTTVDPLVSGAVVLGFSFSNITGLQGQIDTPLRMLPLPAANHSDRPAMHQYIKPTNMFSINKRTVAPGRSVRTAAAFLTDPQVAVKLGGTLGSPPSRRVFELVRRKGDEVTKRILAYDQMVQANGTGPYPPTRPLGADQLLTATGALLGQLNNSVGYEQITPKQAAEDFVSQSKSYLLGAT